MMLLIGLGFGVTWATYVVATQNAVEPGRLGVATAALHTVFVCLVPVAVLGVWLALRIKERPLRTQAPGHSTAPEAA
jgi:threonine/homoserine efflux transporter RhtA